MIDLQKEVLSAKETAERLGCSRPYLYYLIEKKLLTPIEQETVVPHPRLKFVAADVETLRIKLLAEKRLRKEAGAGE